MAVETPRCGRVTRCLLSQESYASYQTIWVEKYQFVIWVEQKRSTQVWILKSIKSIRTHPQRTKTWSYMLRVNHTLTLSSLLTTTSKYSICHLTPWLFKVRIKKWAEWKNLKELSSWRRRLNILIRKCNSRKHGLQVSLKLWTKRRTLILILVVKDSQSFNKIKVK